MLPTIFPCSRVPAMRTLSRLALLMIVALAAALTCARAAPAAVLPPGFEEQTALAGLTEPSDIEIAADGRVFVAEKSGLVKTFDDLADTSARTFADLRTQVHNFSSRGLLGLAVDPGYPAKPYVYVYYTLDAPVGGTPPTFGAAGQTEDACPGDPDFVNCVVSSRVSRLRASGDRMETEQVLVNDWCQQFPFHTGGGLEFGADGYLYVSGGDGARWGIWDYGQLGTPSNPCGDPPGGAGALMTPPTAEGGRLRAQDLTTSGDPLGLAGSLSRIDPETGDGVPGNPMFTSAEPNARRMLAHGFRNPARLAVRPGTSDVWVADRGGGYWEELDRVQGGADPVRNFGWPCYEGGLDANGEPYARVRPRSDEQNLDICESLYLTGNATAAPYWGYDHELPVVAGEQCETNPVTGEPLGNQISGLNFYPATGSFPAAYRNALFFADRLRNCMYAMLPGADGVPKRGRVIAFAQGARSAIDIEVAPNGDLLYIDQDAGELRRIAWKGNSANQAPAASIQADTLSGGRPLTVGFTSNGTSDPDPGDLLIYAWDLDGDGAYDDSTDRAPTHTFHEGGAFTVGLRVTDTSGATATDALTIHVAEPPELTTLTFTPVADARAEEANPLTNFGGSSRLQATASVPARESYLRFQLTGITGRVVGAKLSLTSTTDGTKDGPALHRAAGGWTETGLTWANRPARDTGAVSDVGAIALGAVAEYDAKALVTGDGPLDVALIPTYNDNVDFGSREHAEVAKRPRLEVTFESSVADTQAPSAPTGLTAAAPSHDRVNLSWTPASDDNGVVGYEIYRDGSLLATRGTTTTYADATVQPRSTYEYSVRAFDAAGNRSAPSEAGSVTTPAAPDTQAPSAPGSLTATAPAPRRVELSWDAATDDTRVTAYEVYRDGMLLASTGSTSWSDSGVSPQTTYEYTVRALDAAGNRSAASNLVRIATPGLPTVTLTFSPVADARVDESNATINYGGSGTLQALGGKSRRESFLRFQLAGISGRVASAKLRVTATTDGTNDGPALYRANGGWSETAITWANRPARDASPVADVGTIGLGAVAEYNAGALVTGNGTLDVALASSSNDNVDFGSRELTDTARRPQLVVTFEVESADAQVPSPPGALTAQAPSPDRVNLTWNAASDNVGVTAYEVLRNGALVATVGTATAYTDVSVAPRTTYDYTVRAIDAAGNRSAAGNTATVTTPGAPVTPTTVTFDVAADTHVKEGSPVSNFGTASKLEVLDGTRRTETYLRFALTGLVGTVQAAKLRINVGNDGSANGPAVHGAPSGWTETGLTWANRPARTATAVANAAAIAPRTAVEYNVLPLVTGNGDLTVVLAGDSTDAANFWSREGDATKRAQLVVTYSG